MVDESLPGFWASRIALHPENPFIRTSSGFISYKDVDGLTDRVAETVRAQGVEPGDSVGIQLPSGTAFLVLVLGLAKAGARLSLLSAGLRGRSLRHALMEIPTKLVFTTQGSALSIGELDHFSAPPLVTFSDFEDAAPATSETQWLAIESWLATSSDANKPEARISKTPPDPQPEDILFYIFTSGTTGLPKATQCSHRRYVSSIITEGALFDLTAEDRMYVVLPMFHIAALSAIGAAISVSASVFIRPKFSASQFWSDVRTQSLTALQYLGEILRYLLAQPPSPQDRPNSLRVMLGAGVTKEVWLEFEARFGPVQIIESYGSSEGVIGIFNADGVPGSVGRSAPALEERLAIVAYDVTTEDLERGPNGRLVPCSEGQPGELLARLEDRSQFEGYSSAEATAAKLIEGGLQDGDLWYRSGDLFRQEEGFYFFVGRLGDTYRWKGENISAQEVADALSSLDSVAHSVVYPVNVPGHEGSAGMALVRLEHNRTFDGQRVFNALAAELPVHALPLFLRIGDGKAVLTETYKVGTSELKAKGYAPELTNDPLYLLDRQARAYVPLTQAALRAARLPPFTSRQPPTER
jgi:fatty-acyl-CoA synthase